ncbi:hypothetical protein O3P69_020183 [Scylla paramamosain]|uniref:Uncharacterized protein n=1 Tax=Scylla paramamosain TaxID=85552 RepID=A0AAW0TLM8_SCYPA
MSTHAPLRRPPPSLRSPTPLWCWGDEVPGLLTPDGCQSTPELEAWPGQLTHGQLSLPSIFLQEYAAQLTPGNTFALLTLSPSADGGGSPPRPTGMSGPDGRRPASTRTKQRPTCGRQAAVRIGCYATGQPAAAPPAGAGGRADSLPLQRGVSLY